MEKNSFPAEKKSFFNGMPVNLSASFTFTMIQNNHVMMQKVISAAAVAFLLTQSCKNGDSSVDKVSFDSSIVTKSSQAPVIDTLPQVPQVQNNSVAPSAQQVLNGAAAQTTTISPNGQPTTAAGMNPPHGQPGHRCDIAVGAPLNSPPGKTAATTTTTTNPATTQPVSVSTPTPAVKTAPGMNPPHGEPGHRCDIAVGAPLNSAPSKPILTKTDANIVSPTSETLPKTTSPAAKSDSSKN